MLEKITVGFLLALNLIGFIIVGVDKSKARRGRWRTPEKVFFYITLLGGGIGVYTGLWVFRHKIRKWYFKYVIPLILIVQIGALIYFL